MSNRILLITAILVAILLSGRSLIAAPMAGFENLDQPTAILSQPICDTRAREEEESAETEPEPDCD